VSTPSVAATPLNRNTGAIDDWTRRAISIGLRLPYCGCSSCCCTIVQQGPISDARRTRHEAEPPAASRARRARRCGRRESTRVDLPGCGILRARARLRLPRQLAARVPPERRAAAGGLPHLRARRAVGAGAGRGG